jgi:hypothetical protein
MKNIKNKIIEYGYKNVQEVAESVFLIENFFTENSIRMVWEIIENSSQKDWEKDYTDSQILLAMEKFGRTDLDNLRAEGLMGYTLNWEDKALPIPENIAKKISFRLKELFLSIDEGLYSTGFDTIQRQYENSPLVAHVDNDAYPDIQYAAIGYINDDYVDGELFFQNLNFEIKPPAKSLIIFPGGQKYMHGVKSPGAGPIRYALPSFIYTEKS